MRKLIGGISFTMILLGSLFFGTEKASADTWTDLGWHWSDTAPASLHVVMRDRCGDPGWFLNNCRIVMGDYWDGYNLYQSFWYVYLPASQTVRFIWEGNGNGTPTVIGFGPKRPDADWFCSNGNRSPCGLVWGEVLELAPPSYVGSFDKAFCIYETVNGQPGCNSLKGISRWRSDWTTGVGNYQAGWEVFAYIYQ